MRFSLHSCFALAQLLLLLSSKQPMLHREAAWQACWLSRGCRGLVSSATASCAARITSLADRALDPAAAAPLPCALRHRHMQLPLRCGSASAPSHESLSMLPAPLPTCLPCSIDKTQFPLRCGSWAAVPCDLSNASWVDALKEAGWDPAKPTVWVAEGEACAAV